MENEKTGWLYWAAKNQWTGCLVELDTPDWCEAERGLKGTNLDGWNITHIVVVAMYGNWYEWNEKVETCDGVAELFPTKRPENFAPRFEMLMRQHFWRDKK